MIQLADYLNYLSNEVIQARKYADEQSVAMAKIYAKDEYLKYFAAPRFSVPSIKLEIPLKISNVDAETKYRYSADTIEYTREVNAKIEEINNRNDYKIRPITRDISVNEGYQSILKKISERESILVPSIQDVLNKLEIEEELDFLIKNFELVNDKQEQDALKIILKEALGSRFLPISAKLNNLFFNPNTQNEKEEGKSLIKLNVEMEGEGLRIRKLEDENGNIFEEVIFE